MAEEAGKTQEVVAATSEEIPLVQTAEDKSVAPETDPPKKETDPDSGNQDDATTPSQETPASEAVVNDDAKEGAAAGQVEATPEEGNKEGDVQEADKEEVAAPVPEATEADGNKDDTAAPEANGNKVEEEEKKEEGEEKKEEACEGQTDIDSNETIVLVNDKKDLPDGEAKENGDVADKDPEAAAEKPSEGPGSGINLYATKKTIASGMLDFALLAANAAQTRALLQTGSASGFYHFLLTMLIISIILQVGVGALLVFVGSRNIDAPKERKRLNLLNNIATAVVVLITAINVFVSAFGMSRTV